MDPLTIAKMGGSLIDLEGKNIPLIIQRVRELYENDGRGPILILSAPKGVTDYLIKLGEQAARSKTVDLSFPFTEYRRLAEKFLAPEYQDAFSGELEGFRGEVEAALKRVDKRFERRGKAIVLTSGGELPTAALFEYILRSRGFESVHVSKDDWPVVTNDDYEDAEPLYEESKNRLSWLVKRIGEGKTVCQGGFLGKTVDGLETLLGRGGSDLSAVFTAALLRDRYDVHTLLYKDTPVQTVDPSIVKGQRLKEVKVLTYNEAVKASSTGMKIVQSSAVRVAQNFYLSLKILPLYDPSLSTVITDHDPGEEVVKCITGLRDCAIITIDNDRSKSLEDCLRLWEDFDNFLDLGTEVLESGKVIRDYLILEGRFVRQHEDRIRSFADDLEIEYGVGVVTLIGDKMKDRSGIASIAVGSIPHLNIKRGIFTHTSQITLALNEDDVNEAVASIHKSLARALPF